MFIETTRLGTIYVRRHRNDHHALRPDGNGPPRWLDLFEYAPGEWALHLGSIEVLYTTASEGRRVERRRLGAQLRSA